MYEPVILPSPALASNSMYDNLVENPIVCSPLWKINYLINEKPFNVCTSETIKKCHAAIGGFFSTFTVNTVKNSYIMVRHKTMGFWHLGVVAYFIF